MRGVGGPLCTLLIQVLARVEPEDKYMLIAQLMQAGEVVAVTADALCDLGSLRLADVGVAMGSGCGTVRRNGDVEALDDSLGCVITSILWGRCLHSITRRFVRFQVTTVAMTAVVTFLGVLVTPNAVWPLTVAQLLWLSLLADGLAAFVLATDLSDVDAAHEPQHKTAPLMSNQMWRQTASEALFQTLLLLTVATSYGAAWFGVPQGSRQHTAVLGNLFLLLPLLHLLACRRDPARDEAAYLRGSTAFWALAGAAFALQLLGTQCAPDHMGTVPLSFGQWAGVLLFAALCVPVDLGIALLLFSEPEYKPLVPPESRRSSQSAPRMRWLSSRLLALTDWRVMHPRVDWALCRTRVLRSVTSD